MDKIIAGFDISSSTIGWGIVKIDDNQNISLIDSGYFKPIKSENIIERLVDSRQKIQDILNKYKPQYVGVEDIVKFMPKSTATTVVVLATFNRMVCLTCHDFLKNNNLKLCNVMSIRHGLKISKELPDKKEMPTLVAKHLGITFPFIRDKSNKIKVNKKKDVIEENFDMADGMAVALYYSFILTNKIKKR